MPQVLSESASEEENPSKPLSENKLSSMESAITPTTTEQDDQPAKPQQKARQEQITVATPEICDDDLDNDVDGKVDSRDEECSSTTRSSFPSSRQAQSVTDEQTKEGEDDKEKAIR